MNKSLNFSIVLHDHQPVGNFDHIMAASYETAYLPFMEVLERYPAIRIGMHFSGCLLDWLESHRPDFIDRIAAAAERGQIEILAGGYHEPILTMLPERDRAGQIAMMRDYIRARFGTEVQGLWLTERVWEQNLAGSLARAGIKYTLVDDTHFLHAGLKPEDLDGCYITEDEGEILRVFPIAKKLRYTIPFRNPEETTEYLAAFADKGGKRLLLYGDDGEKFGVWPKTYEHVYQDRWLERFFTEISNNASWIKMLLPSEAIEALPPRGKIYLPDASYHEMTEWALPVQTRANFEQVTEIISEEPGLEKVRQFLKGGFWRNFKAKYNEANEMYSKMMLVSAKVNAMPHHSPQYLEATKRLYEGQCNCAYWHGVFGGLYLPHLRSAIYKSLIAAERIADAALPENTRKIETRDYDFDSFDEIIVQTGALNYIVAPSKGGHIVEMDVVSKGFNLLATLNRRPETYHDKLTNPPPASEVASIHDMAQSKEEGLEKILFYDRYPRKSLVEHILTDDANAEKFLKCELDEAVDFTNAHYSAHVPQDGLGPIKMSARGQGEKDGAPLDISIEKQLTFPGAGTMLVQYRLTNHTQKNAAFKFGSEFNLAMLAGCAHDRYYFTSETDNAGDLSTVASYPALTAVGAADEWSGIRVSIETAQPAEVWTTPVETVSVSEGGFERLYQSSAIMLLWNIEIPAESEWKMEILHKVAE